MAKKQNSVKVLDQEIGDRFSLYHGDSVDVVRGLPDNSIDLTITSPPFCNLYTYSPSLRDMGNTRDDGHFFDHFQYLIPELLRVTTPGRLCVIHCKDLPLFMGSDGVAGLRDFPGELVKAFVGEDAYKILAKIEILEQLRSLMTEAGQDVSILDSQIIELNRLMLESQFGKWVFHSRVTIWKCPKTEMERTNNHGLLHNQLCKDSSVSRQGMADYLLVFRKWSQEMEGLNATKPVNRPEGKFRFDSVDYVGNEPPLVSPKHDPRGYSIETWRKYASPVWFDINQTDVLNTKQAKEGDEPHNCPLQLDVIARCIELWSNPGDIVFDPFNGISSTGYQALKMNRQYTGIELKKKYFEVSVKNLKEAERIIQSSLFQTA